MNAGDFVALSADRGALKPCRHCGSQSGEVREAKGPHGLGVGCQECGRHLGWLPKAARTPDPEAHDQDDFDLIDD